jgi:hypothetical protein
MILITPLVSSNSSLILKDISDYEHSENKNRMPEIINENIYKVKPVHMFAGFPA